MSRSSVRFRSLAPFFCHNSQLRKIAGAFIFLQIKKINANKRFGKNMREIAFSPCPLYPPPHPVRDSWRLKINAGAAAPLRGLALHAKQPSDAGGFAHFRSRLCRGCGWSARLCFAVLQQSFQCKKNRRKISPPAVIFCFLANQMPALTGT